MVLFGFFLLKPKNNQASIDELKLKEEELKKSQIDLATREAEIKAAEDAKKDLTKQLDDKKVEVTNLYKKVDDEIKIRHLVNHTSGIHEYVNLISQKNKVWWKMVGLDNDKIIELLEEQNELEFSPGTKYNYSNSNYNVLAKLIEKVSGEKFTKYSKNFFTRLFFFP